MKLVSFVSTMSNFPKNLISCLTEVGIYEPSIFWIGGVEKYGTKDIGLVYDNCLPWSLWLPQCSESIRSYETRVLLPENANYN